MKTKTPLLFLMVGLLAMSFAIPAFATTPAYLIDPDDVPGWTLWKDGSISEEWNWTESGQTFEMTAWYQIWINNDSWVNATAAIALSVIELNINLNTNFFGFSIWDWVKTALTESAGFTEKSIAGLDGCLTWSQSNVWAAIGYKNNVLIVAVGVGTDAIPGNPFSEGVFAMTKSPGADDASESDILTLMAAQGTQFPGIPGFAFYAVLIGVTIFTGTFLMLRKDRLSLLKSQ